MRLFVCSTLLLTAALQAQQAVERSYDLRPVTGPLPGFVGQFEEPALIIPVGPVLGTEHNEEYLSDGGRVRLEPAAAPWIGSSRLVERLDSLWSQERGAGRLEGDTLHLRAPGSIQTRVHDLLALLSAIRQQSRRIALFELPAGAARGQNAVLSADEVALLLASSPPTRITTATVGHDAPWFWESGRSVRYVRDFDVEVAEKANIGDPKFDLFFAGTRVGLCLTPMIDGRCLVRLGLQETEQLKALTPRQLTGNGLGIVHLPDVRVLELATAAVVPPGGAVLVAGNRNERSWLLRVDAGTTTPLQFGAALALPLGNLAVAPLGRGSSRKLDLARRPGDDRRYREEGQHAPDGLAALDRRLDGQLGNDPERAQTFGSHVVLLGSHEARGDVEAALRREASTVNATSLTFRVGSVENAEATAALADSAAIAGLAATLPTEACLATLPDSHFGVRLGREVAFVGDYEVEIAAKAAAANPVVKTTFDGFRISGMLRQSAGKSRVELRLQWGAVAPFAPIDLANPALGTADTPVTAWTDVEQSVGLAGEGWQIAHLQPDPSAPGERSLVLMVRTR